MAVTYEAQPLIDAQQSFLDLIDGGAGAGKIAIRDSGDVLLGEITLDDPAGTIDVAGLLTLTSPGGDLATTDGTASYAEIVDSNDTLLATIDVQSGVAAVSGFLVINSLSLIVGSPITLLSGEIG